MKDVKVSEDTKFIVFGTPSSLLAQCFNDYFKQNYKNEIIYYYHYAYFTYTDKEWVNGLWENLGINQDFDLIIKKYGK